MKRFSSILIALASLCLIGQTRAATRPHYGGALRVSIQEMPQSFDPASFTDSVALRSLSRLVFENLVELDGRGKPQPELASSWQVEPGDQRWRFQVRSGVIFSDGTPLDANAVAASLRASNPQWKVFALDDLVMIETNAADPNVAAELALVRNSIVRRDKGALVGSGAFTVAQFDSAAKHLSLAANDQYWDGRPFVDSVEVDFGKNYREQIMQLDLGKSDLVEISPEEIRPAQSGNRTVLASSPEELLCLAFARDAQSDAEAAMRALLARSIDTAALNKVVFQAGGEPTGAVLPNWLSGYGFVFVTGAGAAHERISKPQTSWTLSYDANDPAARIVADRILLNAREAGIALQISASENSDIHLLRLPLPSLNPQLALSELARELQLAPPAFSGPSVTDLYSAEAALLQTHRVLPLIHLRNAAELRPNVREVRVLPDGSWSLQNVWLSPETP